MNKETTIIENSLYKYGKYTVCKILGSYVNTVANYKYIYDNYLEEVDGVQFKYIEKTFDQVYDPVDGNTMITIPLRKWDTSTNWRLYPGTDKMEVSLVDVDNLNNVKPLMYSWECGCSGVEKSLPDNCRITTFDDGYHFNGFTPYNNLKLRIAVPHKYQLSYMESDCFMWNKRYHGQIILGTKDYAWTRESSIKIYDSEENRKRDAWGCRVFEWNRESNPIIRDRCVI
jgi:hypothetical protein